MIRGAINLVDPNSRTTRAKTSTIKNASVGEIFTLEVKCIKERDVDNENLTVFLYLEDEGLTVAERFFAVQSISVKG